MARYKRLLCWVLMVGFLLFPSTNMAAASTIKLDATEVEGFLDTIIGQQMEEHNIPNLTVSVVSGGEIILAKGYGYADMAARKPVDPEKTLFRIGSSAKLFTWTSVMQLVEQGKLDLDTDINQYLDFEIPARLEYRGGGATAGPITLRHLMSHTPGFEDYMTEVFSLSEDSLMPLAQQMGEKRPARVFKPGEVSAYSNYGTSLAGYIVELVSGIPFAQYVEEKIYGPLGMVNSTFRQPVPRELADNMSQPYRYVDGQFIQGKFEFVSEPAGSMTSSALDMAKFMLAYLEGGQYKGERILEEATIQKMFSEQFTHHPRLDGMAHGFIKATFNGRDTFHHPGGTMLYDTGLYLLPQEEIGFFISHSGGNYLVNIDIFQAFMDRYFPSSAVGATPEPTADMAKRSQEFVGEYYQNRRSFTNMDAILSLMVGVVRVEIDNGGYLLVTNLGETSRFVEVEPGVYLNLREDGSNDYGGGFRTIVFGTDTLGKTMLMTDGPMSYSKAQWYETSGFTFLTLIFSLLFIIGSVCFWGIRALVAKRKSKMLFSLETTEGSRWARRAANLLGLLTLVFVMGVIAGNEVDPVYGLPSAAYTEPSSLAIWFDLVLHNAIVLVALVVFAFAVHSWFKGYWTLAGRIHYTVFAIFSLALSWIFYFWNII